MIVILFTGVPAHAQSTSGTDTVQKSTDTVTKAPASPMEQWAHKQSDEMRSKLNLTDDQYAQVDKINVVYAQRMAPVLQSPDGRFAKYRKLKPLMEEKDDKMRAVLTKDQYRQYEELKKQMREQYKQNMGN